jgi:hypothetical protein
MHFLIQCLDGGIHSICHRVESVGIICVGFTEVLKALEELGVGLFCFFDSCFGIPSESELACRL